MNKGKIKMRGTVKNKEEARLKRLKDAEDHKLLDAEIARNAKPGNIEASYDIIKEMAWKEKLIDFHYHNQRLDALVDDYESLKRKRPKAYHDLKLFERYESWLSTRSHATPAAELFFILYEYEQLGQLYEHGLVFSPAHLEICLELQDRRKVLEIKLHKEAAASVERQNMCNPRRATRGKFYELMEEGKRLQNSEHFNWGSTPLEKGIKKGIEASVKHDLGAEIQKDEGWQEDLESVIKRAKEHLKNLEPLKEKTAKDVEASVKRAEKQKDKFWQQINQAMKEAEEHIKNLEPLKEKTAKEVEASVKEDERLSLDEKFTKLFHEVEEEPMTFPLTTEEASTSTKVDVNKRWSLEEEVNKLIDQTLRCSFPCLGERSMTYICEDEYGDYQCENVLSIWPKLREEGTKLEGPESVGKKIKIELEKRSDMIEGTPVIHDIGFVTFNLSGEWIAKSLYKMLRYGIDTWAPELPVERVIVEIPNFESPIWNSIVGTEADNIRSSFIRHTLIHMLEFSNVYVKSSEHESRRGVISDIEEKDGDVVIPTKVEGKLEYLNFGKRDINDVSNSLNNLRYELEDEKADWIVSLTHVRHQEFVEMCFAAAQHAGWIPTEEHHGLNFAGYRTHAEAGKLVNLLGKALTRCNTLVKQGKAAEYTAERVFTCTLGYEYLKNHRMAECTFKVDEMLNEEGDTFMYLLNTKNQVLSVLENSRKDNHLKNVTKLIWEKIEAVEKDKGRALGLHLLMFTQVLRVSCLSVLPHILCRYLYNLSQKFTSYRSCSCAPEFGSVAETSRLIMCEATAAVMDKCFNLLGITPVSTFGQSFKEPLKLLLDLESLMGPKELFISRCDSVIPSSVRDPLKHSRLELVAIRPRIARGSEFRRGKLIAHIYAQDGHGLLWDGWGSTLEPDCGWISLYDRAYDCGFIYNHGLVSIGNPNARHSVPLTKSNIHISAELLVSSEGEDDFVHFMSIASVKMSDFWNKEGEGECAAGVLMVGGDKNDDMSALMYFYLLKDAVDATLEMKFTNHKGLKLKGKVFAYYGNNFPYNADSVIKRFHRVTLLEHTDLVVGPVPLTRSKLAVPKDGSLVIKAVIINAETEDVVLEECHELFANIEGDCSFTVDSFSLDLKVDWKY